MAFTKVLEYEETPVKNTKALGRKSLIKSAEHLDSFSLAWLLIKRHKVGLLAIGNVILVLNWVFPAWTELVKSFL